MNHACLINRPNYSHALYLLYLLAKSICLLVVVSVVLYILCRHGHEDIVKYLIEECGCSVTFADFDSQTPLHLACL